MVKREERNPGIYPLSDSRTGLMQSAAMAIGFGGQGLLLDFTALNVIVTVATMTAGSAVLMWIGERITENGVGNGISIVLLFNILSTIPSDMISLYERFMQGRPVGAAALSLVIIVAVIAAIVVFVIILQDAQRVIPVQYSKKMQGRKMVGGQSANIPLKVNTAGVIPVIFASSLMSFPVIISEFLKVGSSLCSGADFKNPELQFLVPSGSSDLHSGSFNLCRTDRAVCVLLHIHYVQSS